MNKLLTFILGSGNILYVGMQKNFETFIQFSIFLDTLVFFKKVFIKVIFFTYLEEYYTNNLKHFFKKPPLHFVWYQNILQRLVKLRVSFQN